MIPFGQFPTLLAAFSKLGPQKRWLGRKRPSPGKPPILPPAKTKLYQIIPAKWMPPADVADLLWRRHAYNNAVLSMRRHFRDEYEQQKSASIGFDLMQKQVNEELDRLLAENDQRNAELAEARAERERETLEKLAEETLLEMERRLDVETQNVKEKSVEVLDMIERSKDFVTKENMEEKIRLALDNPVNFEYAIDLRYNKVENPLPAKYLDSLQQLKQTGRAFDYTGGFGSWKRKPSLARPRRLPSGTGGNEESIESSEPKPEPDTKE